MSKPYNFIYEKLVQGPEDLTGLVAYGLYKREKIEYMEQIRSETGEEATDEQVKDFHRSSMTGSRLQTYRDQAGQLLSKIVVTVLNDRVQEVKDEYDAALAESNAEHLVTVGALSAELTKSKRFFDGVWQNVAANIIAALLVTFVIFGIIASKHGLSDTLADWAGYNPKPPEQEQVK